MTSGPWNLSEVLLACLVALQAFSPLCPTTPGDLCHYQRSGFDDPASRTVRASLVLGVKARRVLGFNETHQGVVFNVERVLKGEYPVIWPSRSSLIVVYFGEALGSHSHFKECLRWPVWPGSRYLVFVDDMSVREVVVGRSHSLMTSVKASGMPRIATEGIVRIVRSYSCSRCGRPPRIQVWPKVVDLTIGKSLDLECRATGRPRPEVTWFKDGVAIPRGGRLRRTNTRNGSRLRIRRVRLKDGGLFHCLASNVLGTSNATRSKVTVSRNTFRRPHSRICEEQTYCLNGGVCLRLKSLKITYCHCRNRFEGERCQQKQLGLNALNLGKHLT